MSTEQPTTLADSILELEGPFTRPGTITLYFDKGEVLTLHCGEVHPVDFLWDQIRSLKVAEFPQVRLNAVSVRISEKRNGFHMVMDRNGENVGDMFPMDVPPPDITGLRSILKPEVCDAAGVQWTPDMVPELPDCSPWGKQRDMGGGMPEAVHQFIRDFNKFIEQH